jgi:hypothetical protein
MPPPQESLVRLAIPPSLLKIQLIFHLELNETAVSAREKVQNCNSLFKRGLNTV